MMPGSTGGRCPQEPPSDFSPESIRYSGEDVVRSHEDVERADLIDYAMRSLTLREADIIYWYFWRERQLKEIAMRSKLSYGRILELKNRAMRKMRSAIARDEEA